MIIKSKKKKIVLMFLFIGVNALSYTWLVHRYASLKTERKYIK